MATLQLKVGGVWVSSLAAWGDLEWSTFEHGSESLSWGMTNGRYSVLRGTPVVELWYGAGCIWNGVLNEPDRDAGTFTAKGAGLLGGDYKCLDGAGVATSAADTAVNQAIIRGLPWIRRLTISSTALSSDMLGELPTIEELVDAVCHDLDEKWAVLPNWQIITFTDPTEATHHVLRGQSLGVSREQYASMLSLRYRTAAGAYATRTVVDTDAEARFGHKEEPVDLTGLGALTNAKVDSIGDGMLLKGKARLGWTNSLEVAQGELLTTGGVPVDINTIRAPGMVLRQHNTWDDTRDLHGKLHIDVPIARTVHKQGSRTVELQPVQMDDVTLEDLIASIPKR